MSIEDYVKNSEEYSFTDQDMLNITDNKYKIWVYENIDDAKSIDDLMGPNKGCIILYQLDNEYNGHWISMWLNGDTIYYFDPYALKIDQILNYSKYSKKHNGGKAVPHLSQLIESSPYKIIYNKNKYQRLLQDVNTCGRWAGFRLRHRNMTDIEFNRLFENKHYNGDFWITLLTAHWNGFNM